ncbi:VOC family protein [Acerihabitans arboris]|uniref:VOC family protein n=1 Tax=Acerihabitans arboris TaxID=2691583 RepID=A0A845SA98_9GAMM|nr:VOC family protein [Acerihabitans arboris]NDL61680.1 VOC family protein [Acerihabitans arboris]
MGTLIPVVDHAVINVADQLDETRELFGHLGFQLTPRGHHSLGSSNHLAIFGENYVELLGYETANADKRRELWTAPLGLAGLVWKTTDADEVYRRLRSVGLAGDPPASFFRPVALSDGSRPEARFRTVRLAAERVNNGRSFFCQHDTPELVWRPEWRVHPNGVTNIIGFVIAAADPAAVAGVYGTLFDPRLIQSDDQGGYLLAAGKTRVRFITPERANTLYGPVPLGENGAERMVALEFAVSSLPGSAAWFQRRRIETLPRSPQELLIPAAHAFNVALLFRAE